MTVSAFNPGFRISLFDGVILLAGMGGVIFFGMHQSPLAFVIGVVIGHFFLFCNVFRIGRASELIWAAVFLALAGTTLFNGAPGWRVTIVTSVLLSSSLIWRETKRPGYHGICWRRWNPELPEWWRRRQESQR